MSIETRLFINNEFVEAKSGKTFPVINPYTGEKVADVSEAGAEDVELAYAAAEAAWRPWSESFYAGQRSYFLRALSDKIRPGYAGLAELEARTMGIPSRQFDFDREVACGTLNYFASLCETLGGETSLTTPGLVAMTYKQPFGVVAGIVPWNAPLIMFAFKVGGAVAAGNAIILKTSEKAPLTTLMLAKWVAEVGFPPGIINIISGYGPTTGGLLASHMKIRKISFTGSTRTGRIIQKASADSNLKVVTLELGGKSPTIIFPDADLGKAAKELGRSVGMTQGQVCMASTRAYIHAEVYDEFLGLFKEEFGVFSAGAGDPVKKETARGPMVDKMQFGVVKRYLEMAKTEGRFEMGGKVGKEAGGELFVEPTIISGASDEATVVKEEIFGPVITVHSFTEEAEAVRRANDSEMGLYAAVYSKDINRALRVARRLEAGSVGINANSPTLTADMPYGGWKGSGIGRELGPHALDAWSEVKALFIAVSE